MILCGFVLLIIESVVKYYFANAKLKSINRKKLSNLKRAVVKYIVA